MGFSLSLNSCFPIMNEIEGLIEKWGHFIKKGAKVRET